MLYLLGFDFLPGQLIVFGILLLTFIYQVYYYLKYIRIVIKNNKKEKAGRLSFQNEKLPVSVIICAKNELENLKKFLPEVLSQHYPDYEVIVVNDGGDELTEILLRDFKKIYPHLRSTFVPDGAKNLSTKKLALTLGIKAAKNDWLLFTDADCMPESKNWIASMARNFTPKTEFVLGYGAYLQEKGLVNRLITYDTIFNGLQYLGFAKAGKPYMGVGRNMAYKKEVFFRQNGFASTLHLKSGDDDLMVNHAADKDNTRVETSVDSITWSNPKKNFRSWYFQKERHLSVSTYYNSKSKLSLVVEPFLRGVFYLSFIALIVLSVMSANWLLAGAASFLFLSRFVLQLVIINKSSIYFGGRKYCLTLLLFDVMLPLIAAYIMTFGRMGSKAKYISWK
ncbi:MAG: glycosyltransferase [Paludibacter sp.]|nr:glycosyltransferase [Paludibacter sp.]MDD4198279.1 glycosyltransferase [Paludibacter sp.]MDD4426985.1 glycosyltransferase [Paludibacter sp.]